MKENKEIKSMLITGGTGSFGKKFIKEILYNHKNITRLVVFSRDELKQWDLQQKYPQKEFPQLRFFLGDIRDKDRLKYALEGIDVVVHAAALKQVPAAEYNPIEFIRTNVLGSENLVQASLDNNVQKVIALSTDKAAAPINLYGATKLCADKLFVAANNVVGSRNTIFSVVRYGNVMGSRGSVIPLFIKSSKNGTIPITDSKMTRFNITLQAGVDMVIWAIENAIGGEIIIPKIPSYRISDLAEAIGPNCKKITLGSRPGEKLHEEMITSSDSLYTLDLGKYFLIIPCHDNSEKDFLKNFPGAKFVDSGFSYNSGSNPLFLTKNELRKLILENVDKTFVPL